jgi:SAM-dependent methyltransferase
MTDYADQHGSRLAADLDIVQQYCKESDQIVEIGAIPLILTLALKARGYRVSGIDIDPSRFDGAAREHGLHLLQCDIETQPLPLESKSVDVVLFNELFEHLRINPIFTMSEIHRVLRPGGMLLMSTPNLRSLNGLANYLVKGVALSCAEDIYDEYQKLDKLGHMGHVREYTTNEVRTFLTKIGFCVERTIYRGRYDRVSLPGLKGKRPGGFLNPIIRVLPRLRPFVTYVARAA